MRAINHFLLTVCTVSTAITHAMAQQSPKELKIGDKLPDITIHSVLGPGNGTLKLNEFARDTPLIINFWATWCIPCIREIKLLDSLSIKHPGKFKVLMVTYQDKETIEDFFKLPGNYYPNHKIKVATNDTLLRKTFPHKGIPHNVWFDPSGTIKAITGGAEMTAENILNFETSAGSKLRMKQDNLSFDPLAPRFSLGDSSFTYRSIITPSIKGVNGGGELYVPDGDKVSRFFMWRGSLLRAYWCAYSNFNIHLREHLIEIHTKDSLKFFTPAGRFKNLLKKSKYKDLLDWEGDHSYFYDLTLPKPVTAMTIRKYMFQDLERQFNVRAAIEPRKITCVVVTKKQSRLLKETFDKGQSEIEMLDGNKLSINRATVDEVLDFLFKSFGKTPDVVPDPFINEAFSWSRKRFNAILDLSVYINSSKPDITIEMVYESLKPFGFRFKIQKRNYPILVLYDQD